MNVVTPDAALWLAAAQAMGALVIAGAMLRARSLLVMAACACGVAALTVAALSLLGGADGALALAAVGVGLAPLLLLGGILLSARTAKPSEGSAAWVSGACLLIGVAGAAIVAPELRVAPATGIGGGESIWLGALVFAACAACAGLLGYGERGVLERHDHGADS